MPTIAAITASNGRKPNRCRPRIRKAAIGREDRRREEVNPEQQVESRAPRRGTPRGRSPSRSNSAWIQEREGRPPGELLAADLGQVVPGGDPELRREGLNEHRHQVRGDDHPDQRVGRTSTRRRCSWRSCPGRCRRRRRRNAGRGKGGCGSCRGAHLANTRPASYAVRAVAFHRAESTKS